jgi:hypothetical protein
MLNSLESAALLAVGRLAPAIPDHLRSAFDVLEIMGLLELAGGQFILTDQGQAEFERLILEQWERDRAQGRALMRLEVQMRR